MKKFLLLLGVFVAANAVIDGALVNAHLMQWNGRWDWHAFAVMFAAAVTLAVFSQLYADNPLFKMVEHLFVGATVAYGLMVTWFGVWAVEIIGGLWPEAPLAGGGPWYQAWWSEIVRYLFHPDPNNPAFTGKLMGRWSIILPGLLGLTVYTRLTKRHGWISRAPMALFIGFFIGYGLPTTISANLLKQLQPMMVDVLHNDAGAFDIQWNAIIVLVGVMATLIYFFFSLEHKGVVGGISRVGIWFLMVAFGASFGYTVMSRLSILLGRVNFLFHDWIPLIP